MSHASWGQDRPGLAWLMPQEHASLCTCFETSAWDCGTGFTEVGETLEQAVVREVSEEAGELP